MIIISLVTRVRGHCRQIFAEVRLTRTSVFCEPRMGEKVRGLSRAEEEVQNHGPKSAGGESLSRHSQVKVHHRARDRGRCL